jgi:hypothetical protein
LPSTLELGLSTSSGSLTADLASCTSTDCERLPPPRVLPRDSVDAYAGGKAMQAGGEYGWQRYRPHSGRGALTIVREVPQFGILGLRAADQHD